MNGAAQVEFEGETMKSSRILLTVFLAFACWLLAPAQPASAQGSAAAERDAVRRTLTTRYLQLLMEKGIFDDAGREIDGRLGRMVAEARRTGKGSDKDILEAVLTALNYSPSNLGGFPACAFDRPVGDTLQSFGHTIADGNIDARASGSACPVGGIGAGGFERLMNGNFETWFLKSGWMVEDTVWADQFHVYMRIWRPDGRPDSFDGGPSRGGRPRPLGLEVSGREGRLLRPLPQVGILIREEPGLAGQARRRPVLAGHPGQLPRDELSHCRLQVDR